MTTIRAQNFAAAYQELMNLIYNHYEFESSPRGLKIRECLNVLLEIADPYDNLFRYNDKNLTMPTGYLKKEMALYLLGTDDSLLFSKASSFWNTIKRNDNKINSAYGNLIFNKSLKDGRSQFDWAFDCLKKDKDSRQAFMRFNNTSHQYDGNKDVPCTFIEIFHIRNNKLYATVDMRSNDIIKGTTYDIPSFMLFQHLMLLRLREVYPDLEIGTYTHIGHSVHLYESDFELVENRLKSIMTENKSPMPNNWNVIKSEDIYKVVDIKVNKQLQLFNNWQYSENKDFYDWIIN